MSENKCNECQSYWFCKKIYAGGRWNIEKDYCSRYEPIDPTAEDKPKLPEKISPLTFEQDKSSILTLADAVNELIKNQSALIDYLNNIFDYIINFKE